MRLLIVIAIFFLFAWDPSARAQYYHTRQFTMEDGMPSNAVRSILKDSRGYLWVGTDAGLCRFDGKEFRIYSQQEGFGGTMIWSMAEDGQGHMWFGDYGGGLWKYDGRRFFHFTEADSLADNRVRKVFYSEKWDLLMVGTQAGITIYDGNRFRNYGKKAGNLPNDPWVMEFIQSGNMIGIYTFDVVSYGYYPDEGAMRPFSAQDTAHEAGCMTRFLTSRGDMIRSFRRGIEVYARDGRRTTIIKPENTPANEDMGEVFGMSEDRQGNIWMSSWTPNPNNPGGLLRYDGSVVTKMNDILGKDPISGWSVLYDGDDRVLWFGSLDMGLFMVRESIFEYLDPEQYGLESFNIADLDMSPGWDLVILNTKQLFISHPDGTCWKADNRLFSEALLSYLRKTGIPEYRIKDYPSFMNTLKFTDIAFERDSILWVNSEQGIFRVSPDNGTVKCFSKSGYGAGKIHIDAKGRLLNLAQSSGYMIIKNYMESQDLVRIHKTTTIPLKINDVVAVPASSELWIASWSTGLYRGWDTTFINYNSKNSALEDNLNVLCLDDEGHLIVGSNSGNVYITRSKSDSLEVLETIGPAEGLQGNSVRWLGTDRYGWLWAGTNTGLNRIDLGLLLEADSLHIHRYDIREGYLHTDVNATFTEPDGNILMGSGQSLARLHVPPPGLPDHEGKKIVLTGCEINGRSGTVSGLQTGKEIEELLAGGLSHKENYLHFNFDVINFLNPGKDLFRHYLDGIDRGWSDFSGTRHIAYPNLRPGHYTLRIEGMNLNTGARYEPLAVTFTIETPFWQTWWFIALMAAAGLAATIAAYRNRIGNARRKEQQKAEISRQLAELEMKALLAQMNPHFTFNAINSIQNYILDNDVDKALSYLSDFSKIIRQTLEQASKEFITLEEEVDYIRRYLKLEQMRFDNQFELELTIDPAIDPGDTKMPPMILQPYVENAIKHGLRHKKGKGRLSITFGREEGSLLRCTIGDNGVGRAASSKINSRINKGHSGAGMEITRGRIAKLREVYNDDRYEITINDLIAQNGRPEGTRVEVTLPLMEIL